MGKSQKKRNMRRHNPMRVPDSHLPKGLASASSSSSKTEAILPIIQKMESPDPTERKWACVAVSNLIYNDPSTRRLLQGKDVVGVLIGRLADSEEEVVVEAAGALRNLCIDGGYEICAEMFNKNIIAPLRTFIPKISTTLAQYIESPKTAPENAQKVVYEFADNVITILWCLSETSNKALNAVNQLSLIQFLMAFLAFRDKLPLATVTSAAQCLYVLTDDNAPAIEDVRTNLDHIACLLAIANARASDRKGKAPASEERAAALSILACGILRNLAPIPPPSAAASLDLDKDVLLPVLVPAITSTSVAEATAAVQQLLARQAGEPPIQRASAGHAPKSDHKSESELELERIETRLRAIQFALEILTGICATLPDPDEAVEDDGEIEEVAEADVDDNDEQMDLDDAPPTTSGPTPPSSSFLPTILEPLLALIQPTALSFPPYDAPSPHPPTTSALSAIHISALECLNNAFLSLAAAPTASVAADVAAGQRVWDAVWRALSATGTDGGAGQERRMEVWGIAVGVLWGIGIVWAGKIPPQEEQVKILMQLCDSREDPTVRVKCIGTLESLAQNPDAIDANRVIATYLLSLLPTAAGPSPVGTEPLLQAVSALIDIYADEGRPYDVNFRTGGYLDVLAGAIEGLRKAVKGIDRKKEGGRELRRRGEEVRDNLVAFVQYRRQLGV
ncbi:ARM repeat-containing protein [Auriscalpium vulgare]|uniref:ARM repeat-containing protein n=1 Tax=Auriscalpium vulgare TaxID=40419 RepID=A0ACB8SAG9_9AGAM|nr:ARM repeat-containing protein [Auriscalpium vulgare]